jgi:hypothetical protein
MRPALALIVIAMLSCSSSPTEPGMGDSASLRFGQTTTIAGRAVSFTDIADSRCPRTVVCAWAGDAAVRLESASDHVILHTNTGAGPATGTLAGVTLTLVEVRPERVTPDAVKKSDYSITVRLSE